MRIVIDMQGAQTESRFRGIGRYTMAFARAVVRNRGEHEVVLALSGLFPDTIEPIRASFHGLLPQESIHVWHAPGPVCEQQSGNQSRRETAELLREAFLASLRPDIIHVSSLFEGYVDDAVTSVGRFDTITPVSVVLYDLIPLLNSEHYLKPNPSYEKYYLRKVEHLRRASLSLAISDFTREEGIETLGIESESIVSISTAIDDHFRPQNISEETAAQLCQKFGISRPFVLYTGGADERKNLPRLIEAFAALPTSLRRSYQLIFAGKMSVGKIAYFNQVARSAGLEVEELAFTGYVTDQELVQLYNLCALYVFPSWHEGFGLPALEAMACGAPVVGAATSSLPEVIGLAEALFDPFDVAAISKKMAHALGDEQFRSRLQEHGIKQAAHFSWDESAKRAIRAWTSLQHAMPRPSHIRGASGKRPRLAFVSPLPPERTGIADYSAELLPALSEHYDIELVIAQDSVNDSWVEKHGHVRDVAWLRNHVHEIDRVLYQIGNSPYHRHMLFLLEEMPGTVVLHDFYLSGLMAWLELHGGEAHSWTRALYTSHGYCAVRERHLDAEAAKRSYPVNWHVLQHAQGVIVHSNYSRSLARKWYGDDLANDWMVIPHLRSSAAEIDRLSAREQLRIDEDDFVVCSFGFLDPTKLNHRLLHAWLESDLAQDKRCHLVFVGENHGGDYGTSLLSAIRSSAAGDRIRITGFAAPELFQRYLSAADLAVQLRTSSRGETSGTVLDCMGHAVPLIVNANGSMAELDREAAWILPDEFTDAVLVEALETLWRDPERRHAQAVSAREIILRRHAPAECAKRYQIAIEHFHRRNKASLPALVNAISKGLASHVDDLELVRLSSAIASNLPQPQPSKRIFLDITATCRNDLKTGIERVARALVLALLESPPIGYRIEPVYLSDVNGVWHHRYARTYTLSLLGYPANPLEDEPIDPESGDVLLTLDLSGDILIQAERSGLFRDYRRRGMMVYATVFDLLPVTMPEVFPPGADETHSRWLDAISNFDGAVCISRSVADELRGWLDKANLDLTDRGQFSIDWFHLGSDVANSAPTVGVPEDAEWIIEQLSLRPSFLMVGTIEPRKGYLQMIEAFSQLWNKSVDVNLVVVGKEGWRGVPDAMRRDIPQTLLHLRTHPELNKRLFWLEGISDEYLEKVYAASTCLIAASFGEGFGLPLIEASNHKIPIIARDIPVFREIVGDCAFYFSADSCEDITSVIVKWIELKKKGRVSLSSSIPRLTWRESANILKQKIIQNKTEIL